MQDFRGLSDDQVRDLGHAIARERENRRMYAGGEANGGASLKTALCDSPGASPLNRRETAPIGEEFTLDNIDEAMAYQPWMPDQQEAGTIIREALTTAAKAILRHAPVGRYRSVAMRQVLDARMNANAAISFRGRF